MFVICFFETGINRISSSTYAIIKPLNSKEGTAMKKADRHRLILSLINEQSIETQDELIQMLSQQGVMATQATISRDIRELGIVKRHDAQGKVRYVQLEEQRANTLELEEVIAEMVTHIVQVQFMLILHTQLGTANMVAVLIDEAHFAEVAGTIAGTDTVVIILVSEEQATLFKEQLETIMEKE